MVGCGSGFVCRLSNKDWVELSRMVLQGLGRVRNFFIFQFFFAIFFLMT